MNHLFIAPHAAIIPSGATRRNSYVGAGPRACPLLLRPPLRPPREQPPPTGHRPPPAPLWLPGVPEKPTSTRVVSIEPASRRAATESFILRGGVMPNQTNLDPFVPEVLEEPYAVYAELRRRGVY